MPADEGKLGSGSSVSGSDISNIVQLFTGKSTSGTTSSTQSTQNTGAVTNTGTTTTGTSISSDAMAAMLKSVLESNQGLASTALGEHSAGLYNSSTNQLLQNDLITRAASQVAQQAKTQVTTQNTAQNDTRGSTTSNVGNTTGKTSAPINPATAGKGAAAIAGLGAISKFIPAGAGTSIVQKIKNGIGIGDGANTAMIDGAKLGAANANTEAADLQTVYPSSAPSSVDNTIGGLGVSGPTSDAGDMDFGGGDTSSMSDFGNAVGGIDIAEGGDYGSVDYSGEGYDPGFGDVGADAAANFTDFGSDVVDAGSSGFGDLFDMFAADGGMIRDPNRPDAGPVSSNLSFAQANPVAMQMAQSIRPRSTVAGYADGGAVDSIARKAIRVINHGGVDASDRTVDESGRRHANTDQRVSESAKAEMPAYGFDGLNVNDIEQLRREKARLATYADGGQVTDVQPKSESIFDRRRAAIDAAEGATNQGTDTNKAYQDRMGQQSQPTKTESGLIPTIRKVLHLANGGAVGFFDDGGHVDLTNLGLRVQPVQASSGTGLAALSAPSDANSSTSGGEVTGPQDHGTGFANTSNQTLTTDKPAPPQVPKKSTNPSNGNTRTEPAGESNSSAPGTAQGGIDANPQSVQNAAVSLGLALTPLAPLAPLINIALAALNAPAAAAGATSAASSGAAAAAGPSADGTVSVGNMSADDGMDGQAIGTMSAAVSDDGPNAEGSVSNAATSDASGPAGQSTSDGGVSDSGIGDGSGVGGGIGGSGNSAGGDSGTGDSAGGDGGDGGASAADGGLITMLKSYFNGGSVIGKSDNSGDDDAIPAKLTNNEFVMNPEASAQFRPLLEMMNNAVRARK
jgi:hypothetical protein